MRSLVFVMFSGIVFGQITEDYGKKLNDAFYKDRVESAKKKNETALAQFVSDAIAEIESQKTKTRDITLGNFVIRIQQNCDIKLPDKPVIPNPVEVECASAHEDALILAEKVKDLTKSNVQTPAQVSAAMGKCAFKIDQSFAVTIYDNCMHGEFDHYYKIYFDQLKDEMAAKGFTYDPVTNRFNLTTPEFVQEVQNEDTFLTL